MPFILLIRGGTETLILRRPGVTMTARRAAVSAHELGARIKDVLGRAVRDKERVVIRSGNKRVAALVPIEDLKFLEDVEDRLDAEDFRKAKEEFERSGGETLSWEKLKAELGLK